MNKPHITMLHLAKTRLTAVIAAMALCCNAALMTACQQTDNNNMPAATESAQTQPADQPPTSEFEKTPDYEGAYLDEDTNEPNLTIEFRKEDGKYDVKIGIYRLTYLDDGIGVLTNEGLRFTATDASGNPIGGIITLQGDTATVTFTDTTWDYLPSGSQFLYFKQRQ